MTGQRRITAKITATVCDSRGNAKNAKIDTRYVCRRWDHGTRGGQAPAYNCREGDKAGQRKLAEGPFVGRARGKGALAARLEADTTRGEESPHLGGIHQVVTYEVHVETESLKL